MINYKEYLPKILDCFDRGYSFRMLLSDLLAGLTVGVIALPLALAFAIGSGVSPEKGLFTAIIAGFAIALLGGSRTQIAGPTGAFVVVVYSIVQQHGYQGLALATLMAGTMMIFMGLARFGFILKFIPFPVITGFTSGIAVVIFMTQIKDFFGLQIDHVPAEFWEKCVVLYEHLHTWSPISTLLSTFSLALIFLLRHYAPNLPGIILVIIIITPCRRPTGPMPCGG